MRKYITLASALLTALILAYLLFFVLKPVSDEAKAELNNETYTG